MYLDGKRLFLAGATGLVGSNVIEHVLQDYPRTQIRAVYHRHTQPFIEHPNLEYVQADLKSSDECREAVRGCDCAIMAAFASSAGAGVSQADTLRQVHDNLFINAQLLEAFAAEQVRRVVSLGSVTLYQEFEGHIREDELDLNQDPHPAYAGIGWIVRFIEKLGQFWHQQTGLEIIGIRSANIFGPYAKFDPRASNFIPAIIRKAVDRIEPFEVWGTPEVTRDVIYAEDFARAVTTILNSTSIKSDVFNIGSGSQTTVGEVVSWALKYAGHQPRQIVYQTDRPVTNKFRALDCTKAHSKLNWRPHYPVEEGIKKTTEWWIKNKNWWTK